MTTVSASSGSSCHRDIADSDIHIRGTCQKTVGNCTSGIGSGSTVTAIGAIAAGKTKTTGSTSAADATVCTLTDSP